MRTEPITEFRGEFYFLSNYYTAPMVWRNMEFHSAEQAFAYAKTLFCAHDKLSHQTAILGTPTPGEAKKRGRQLPINVVEWDKNKVQYMREIVHAKFLTGEGNLVGKLINTGSAMLVEGNDWGDTFWGRCDGRGRNVLGAILIEERGWWSRSDEGKP